MKQLCSIHLWGTKRGRVYAACTLAIALLCVPASVWAETPGAESNALDSPPIQVRRVVDVVVPTAENIAERVARNRPGGTPVARDGSAERVPAGPSEPTSAAGRQDAVHAATTSDVGSEAIRRTEERVDASVESAGKPDTGESQTWAEWAKQFWQSNLSGPTADEADGSTGALTAEPYVEDRKWHRAMRLLERGECKQSLDLVDQVIDQSDRDLKENRGIRYVVARIKMCTPGYGKRGRNTMRSLAAGEDVVAELARRRLGLGRSPVSVYAGSEGNDFSTEQVLPSYVIDESEKTAPRSKPTTNEVIREARSMAREGRVDEAVDRLQDYRTHLEDDWATYRTYEVQGSILWRAGRREDAARAYRGAYRLARSWDRGGELEDRLERMQRGSDVEILPLGSRVDRMRELIADGEYYRAKQVSIHNADIAGVKGREIEGWSYFRRALEAEQQRDRDHAAELFAKAEARVESDVIRPRLYYGWARALRRIDRDSEAIELYDRLCREYPQSHLCDDARYQAGRLSVYDNDFEEARQYFADVVGLHPDSSRQADALWLGGFSAYLAGDYQHVHRPLQILRERYGDRLDSSGTPLSLKARYWQAVASLKMGDHDTAERELQAVINDTPLSWYGRLAAARLEKLGVAPVVPVPTAELSRDDLTSLGSLGLPNHPAYQVAREYAKLGLYNDAADDVWRQLRVEPSPPGARHLLATLWLLGGKTHEAHWMMNDYLHPDGPTIFDLRTWGLAYPVEFLEESHKWGREYSVDPLLIQSVIRQESGFRAGVASYAGAVGLMQLMPGTANYTSNEWFDGAWVSRAELRTPNTNVRFGTAYLRAMLGHTNGNVAMALAGYNAGPAPMRRWFQAYGDREVDAWVESLTYDQARGYVRKVFTNYVRYTALYAGRSRSLPSPTLELPSELAPWGQVPELQQDDKVVSFLNTL